MLVEFKIQNFWSFNDEQTLSMVASTSTKESCNAANTITVNKMGIECLIKSAAIFGANAAGKSNLAKGFYVFRKIVLESLKSLESDSLNLAVPFLIKDEYFDIPTEFEVTFFFEGKLYRYGLSLNNGKVSEEWLYWTKTSRETMLFHRNGQKIIINERSFSEAKDFVKQNNGVLEVDKTKDFIPFVSVLAQFDGEKSNAVVKWFWKLNLMSGISDQGVKGFTINLFESNLEFKKWALKILNALQIQDVRVVEVERDSDTQDKALDESLEKIESFLKRNKSKEKKLEIIKTNHNSGKDFVLPISFESEGTRKLIYMLGPLFDILKNDEILVVDEFDSKFHSLLSKFIINLYHQNNMSHSQLILTCHDTNLLSKDLFRRDQIWFIEKNDIHESQLYSLLEYKEHYARLSDSYGKDYLAGKYGAIPLFESVNDLIEVLND